MKYFLSIILFSIFFSGVSQSNKSIDSLYKPDPNYLEDQFYFGISYIVLQNLPTGIKQNGFSNAIKLGYIRDIPINEQRNIGLGIGLGYCRDIFYQNLRISTDENTGELVYDVLEGADYQSNSFSLNKIEMPFELRFRGSSPTKYKFWRVYAGATLSYVASASANYTSSKVNVSYNGIKNINPWQAGLNISAGYGTWNFNYYYGLTKIIKDNVSINGNAVQMKEMRFGIMYYFL